MFTRSRPRFNNCLFGAMYLMWRYKDRSPRLKRWPGRRHLYVRMADGRCVHFKRLYDILPCPLCYLVFVGVYTYRLRAPDAI